MIPKKILFCTDFSENSLPARGYAIDFAKAFGASLDVLHVVNSSRLGYPAFEAGVPFDLQSVLLNIEESVKIAFNDFLTEFEGQLTEISTTSRIGVPAVEITRFAEENGINLIIMGTHGWTGFRHLILGSTAENVVRTAKCPVLTVKSSEGAVQE
ncbi:MAG: universal stress protein [Deltaproteobacteria bacterium]|nr:universal stress protein [Deltaproteobacteria bacterium]